MRKYLLIILLTISSLFADEFIVKSFTKLENDLSARKYVKYDINGDACALIKVRTDIKENLSFDSNMGIPHAPELKEKGEYWVYVAEGERALKCMADGFMPKMFSLERVGKIKSLTVYELRLSSKDLNVEKLPINIITNPEDTDKWIDGVFIGKGENFELSIGDHELLIKKEGRKSFKKKYHSIKIVNTF